MASPLHSSGSPRRIDAHQHFWQYDPAEHAWMTDKLAALRRDFMPQDLKPLLQTLEFDGCVTVQVRQNVAETRWMLELADRHDFIRGVVGWVDLCSPDLLSQLDHFAGHPKLVGVRHIVQDEPDDQYMLREDFRRGIAELGAFGLTYDVLVYPRQLPAAIRLVEEFPDQRFVLDHIAKPPIAEGRLGQWEPDLRRLSELRNIWCKLSGMVTEARWSAWQPSDFDRYLDVVFEAFGPDRLMIGSDWPVCTLAAEYADAMGIVLDYIRQVPPREQAGILGENCARFYGLE
jgi:L-fuconolactonase